MQKYGGGDETESEPAFQQHITRAGSLYLEEIR